MNGVLSIALHLLLPFLAGQALQVRLEPWMRCHLKMVRRIDLASILLMVYGAISAATLSGMWTLLPVSNFLVLALVDAVLLAAMLGLTAFAARRLGFSREDEIAIVFCGSKKSLARSRAPGSRMWSRPLQRPVTRHRPPTKYPDSRYPADATCSLSRPH